MSKRVTKITIGPNNGVEQTSAMIIFFEEGVEEFLTFSSWTEIPIFLEERFYSKKNKTYYVPEDK